MTMEGIGHENRLAMMQFITATGRIGNPLVLFHGERFWNALGTHDSSILHAPPMAAPPGRRPQRTRAGSAPCCVILEIEGNRPCIAGRGVSVEARTDVLAAAG